MTGFLTVCILGYCCLQPAFSSYLGYPRLHFSGQYRADMNTRNNDNCNYRTNREVNNDTNGIDWGFNGTNEIQFYDVKITSVVYQDGSRSTLDPVVGRGIVGNLQRPFAKLVDIDVDAQMVSTIYGLDFGIKWSDGLPRSYEDDIAFYGNWTRNVIAQFIWPRITCYDSNNAGNQLYQSTTPLGAQSTTTVTNVEWNGLRGSRALMELRDATAGGQGGGALAVRISLSYYTRNYPPYVAHNATLGYVSGVIGVPSPSDTLNVPGQRAMFASGNLPVDLVFPESGDLCSGQELSDFGNWMNTAPFEFDSIKSEIHLDLSNSLPAHLDNSPRDIGTLRLGILILGSDRSTCVYPLGDQSGLDYLSAENLWVYGGIFNIPTPAALASEIEASPMVIAQILDHEGGSHMICSGTQFSSSSSGIHSAQVLLQELPFYIRPVGYYLDRLEIGTSSVQHVYVTSFGHPASGIKIQAVDFNHLSPPDLVLPENGVIPISRTSITDENGMAIFEYEINSDVHIPSVRTYSTPPCTGETDPDNSPTLAIDGQVYYFFYCPTGTTTADCTRYHYLNHVMLAFSSPESNSVRPPYTWVDHVGPILAQYAHISRVMSDIMNLSSYHDVTRLHNVNLIRNSLSLDFNNPSYMPTTRDLSPSRRNMILEWLNNPIFDSSSSDPPPEPRPVCVPPEPHPSQTSALAPDAVFPLPIRCMMESISFAENPRESDAFFEQILFPTFRNLAPQVIPGRPLFRGLVDNTQNCTAENVKTQLQTAIQLEWATIPTYLTSLYSIVEGCNVEIYELVRSVIVQEMLHMTQSANTLIAMGGSPLIDSASVTPSFPTRLPGGVLPGLEVSLERLSLRHVHDVFMGIEVPEEAAAGNFLSEKFTIGEFYEEISECINILGDSIFDPNSVSKQVRWPWTPALRTDDVIPVTDSRSARLGIEVIISQGEGAGLLQPEDIEGETLAHFYKFEEIVCQRKLERSGEGYAYNGPVIPFDSIGVWPMRPNPKAADIAPHTNCYTESRVFHQTYRKLLTKMQEVFNGHPEDIFTAVELMESLQVHAKRLMWVRFQPESLSDNTTCGPVWVYDWPEPRVTVPEGSGNFKNAPPAESEPGGSRGGAEEVKLVPAVLCAWFLIGLWWIV